MPPWTSGRMLLGGVIFTLAIALGGLGVGFWALSTSASNKVGPIGLNGIQGSQGPQGSQGTQGAQGIQGLQGQAGATGKPGVQGPKGPPGAPGTLQADLLVAGTPLETAPNPPAGTTLTSTTSCPAHTVLLSGGAFISAPGSPGPNVALRSSYPASAQSWRTVGQVTAALGVGQMMTLKPFVLCGAA